MNGQLLTCASCGNKQYVHLQLVEVCDNCGAKNWTT
ncbi:MAG: protein NinF [Nitrososphaeraceae archaeon]